MSRSQIEIKKENLIQEYEELTDRLADVMSELLILGINPEDLD